MQQRTRRFDRLVNCPWSHSNDFPGLSPELPQQQLFHFPRRFYLEPTSAIGKKQIITTIRDSSNGMGTTAPFLYAWLYPQLRLPPASGYEGYVRRRMPSRPERILTPFSNETQQKSSDPATGRCLRFFLRMSLPEPMFSCKGPEKRQEARTHGTLVPWPCFSRCASRTLR